MTTMKPTGGAGATAATVATGATGVGGARGNPAPTGTRWTPEQRDAITARRCNLLVSAGAGAGKTSVLVERVIGRITDPAEPADIDDLLVVTFTAAAAAEMRERIASALDGLLARGGGGEGDARLARQLALVRKADISTIHSFCHKVVRQHFYRLGIDPAFRVMDEVEAALLRLEVADDLFEARYADPGSDGRFIDLVDAYGGERGDEALRDLVIRIYEYSRGQPRPDAWFDQIAGAFDIDPGTSINDLPWTRVVLDTVARDLSRAHRLFRQALELAGTPGGPGAYMATLEKDVSVCSSMLEAAGQGDFATLSEIVRGFAFGKLQGVKAGSCSEALKGRVKALRDDGKKLVNGIRDAYFSCPPEDLVEDLREVAPVMQELVETVRRFAHCYAEAKRARGLLDFSDLEHLCLQTLGTWDENTRRFEPTDVARELAGRYKEVLVDEYQDINPVQDAILALVARGDDTFVVGDVKQSIYGFRLAEPGLFAEKYHAFSTAESGTSRKIDLSRNFRSRKSIIDAVNFVFRQVFSEGIAGIAYDRPAELVYGADYPDDPEEPAAADAPVEVHIIERKAGVTHGSSGGDAEGKSRCEARGEGEVEGVAGEVAAEAETREGEGEPDATGAGNEGYQGGGDGDGDRGGEGDAGPTPEEVEALELEGRLIANRIREMVRGTPQRPGPEFRVYDRDRKTYRPVSYRDIVVLLRSTRHRANVLLEVFRRADVPAYAELGTGYFEATEVEVMVSLLQVIDNPMQDIPLAAVLRSPIYGFSADDLARIRGCHPGGDFYTALEAASSYDRPDPGLDSASDAPDAACAHTCGCGCDHATDADSGSGLDPGFSSRSGSRSGSGSGDGDFAGRARGFLEDLERWRTLARRTPLSTLIWHLYRETGYLDYVGGMPGGAQRQANLRALHERARQFDRFARQGLFRFLRFIDRLREAEGDLGTARALGEAEDVVRIMSVHKSKGLEFPVVFLADLGKNFNFQDLAGDVLLHSEAGLGPVLCDTNRRVKYPTIAHHATREKARADALAEEMRILYVAMTRAKERLILVGSAPNLEKQAGRWCEDIGRSGWALSDDVLVSARGILDWVASALARHRSGFGIRELATVPQAEPCSQEVQYDQARFEVRIWNASDVPDAVRPWSMRRALAGLVPLEEMALAKPLGRGVAPEVRRSVEEHLGWAYPYAALAGRAAKATWSEIKRRFEPGRDDAEPSRGDASEARPVPATFSEQPRFMQAFETTPAERGQAAHLVLQHLDLGGRLDVPGIRKRVDDMVERDLLTRDLARSVDVAAIARFFETPIGRRVVEERDLVRREVAFCLGIDARAVYPDIPATVVSGERVVVQGIIDCLIDEGDGFVLIDFKTGVQARHDPEAAAREYAGQITVYTAAIESIYERPVKEAYLYFLGAGMPVPVDCRDAARRLLGKQPS
ncbi:MAG: UvrD-helicase domain-containing protein [Bacillota bacterium]|nr:UvrD-helicase domain-containing protein [Bacillota bacterium]